MIDLIFAGDSSGYPDATPGKMWSGGANILLSYEHPARERATKEIMQIFLAGQGIAQKINLLNEFGYDRLFSYELNQKLADLAIIHRKILDTIYKLYFETDIFTRGVLKQLLTELYFAGADGGSISKRASVLLPEGDNILLSYARGDQKAQVEKIIKLKEELMELYMVGPEKANIMAVASEELEHNMLFSYLDKTAIDKYKEMISSHGKLFIDSGAFSAWTQGKVIDVDEYIRWINDRADYIDLYGQIDVIPGDRNSGALPSAEEVKEAAQKTWENYLYMRPKMKKPEGLLYTFHVGEPIEFLKKALEWTDDNGNYIPYIALGGMVGKSAATRDRFLEKCFSVISKSPNPNVKVHAFGMTDRDLLMKYPITSADSTSWIMTGATGGIMTDVGMVTVSSQQAHLKSHYSHLPKEAIEEFNKTIKEFGFTLDELAESRDKRIMHNARYMKKKFEEIEYKPPQIKKRRLF